MSKRITIRIPLRVAGILVLLLILGSAIAPVLLPGLEPYIQTPQVEASPAEGDYIDSWDISSESGDALSITTDGTNIWIVDYVDTEVYKYSMTGTYIDHFDISLQSSDGYGITTDGSNIWISDFGDTEVYKYTMAGVYVDSWDTSGQATYLYGVATDGNYIWAVDWLAREVYKYSMAGVYTDEHWDVSGQTMDSPDITTDGNYIWIVSEDDDEVYKYEMDGTYITSWDISSESGDGYGITTDGINIWIVDYADTEVYKYEYMPVGVTVTQTFLSTTTTDATVCIYTVVQVIIDPITTVTVTSSSYTTTGTTVVTSTATSTTTCDTSVDSSTSSTTTCDTSIKSSTSSTTTCDTSISSSTTCTSSTDTSVSSTTTCTTSVSTSETCTTTCETSVFTSESTSCVTQTVTHTTECITTCETSTETSVTTTCTTTCETSVSTSETCTTTCEISEFTTSITTTFTTGDLTTTTVVRTVVYDACVIDEFDDDALVAWYNNTHRHDSIVDVVHDIVRDHPDAILTLIGTLDAGNLTSILNFDDIDSYNVSEVTGTPGYDIRFNFTGLTDTYTNINCSLYIWYDGGAGDTVEMQVWNYTSGIWLVCGTITEGAGFAWFNHTHLSVGHDVVRGGILRGRIVHTSPGKIAHDIYIDYIEARLDANPCGQVYSENMLAGLNVTQIVYFRYNITIPPGGYANVQFSQDNATWVDSGGIAQWEDVTDGDHSIVLTGLDWAGNFYYRAHLHKNVDGTSPELDLAQVCYSTIPVGGASSILPVIALILFGGVAIAMVGMRKRRW